MPVIIVIVLGLGLNLANANVTNLAGAKAELIKEITHPTISPGGPYNK